MWVSILLGLLPQESLVLEPVVTLPSDGTILGEISDVDMFPDGTVIVLDGLAHQILLFDKDGDLIRTLGRDGEGPGEIKGATEVEVAPDGSIVVLDWGNTRFTRWAGDGELTGSTPLDGVLRFGREWPHQFLWSSTGPVLKTFGFMPGSPIHFVLLSAGLDSVADTLAVVETNPDDPGAPFKPYAVEASGRILIPRGDTLYAIDRVGRDGRTLFTYERTDLPAAARTEEEGARLRADLVSGMSRMEVPEGIGIPEPEIPPFHSRFGRLSMGVDDEGRLWLAPAVNEGMVSVFDVLAPDGRLIASVAADARLRGFKIKGDHLLAISETPIGEPIVRVYRISRQYPR